MQHVLVALQYEVSYSILLF